MFEYYITINNERENNEILNIINDTITLNNILPQGAVTSPVVSNIIFRQLDIRIQKYCRKLNFHYSRYADDMLFSSFDKRLFDKFFIKAIINILNSKNFSLNNDKTVRDKNEISLNGFVVGKNIRLSRKRKKDISKILFLFKKNGKPNNIDRFIDQLNSDEDGFLYRKKRKDYDDNEYYFKNKSILIDYLAGYRSFLIDWIPEESSFYYDKHVNLINDLEEMIIYLTDLE